MFGGGGKLSLGPISTRADEHEQLPHVVKFSGGRSSAALTFLLAEAGLLRPERGDVVLFGNTSAEHPATYRFAAECKHRLERDYGIPCLWFEFATVEDVTRSGYSRRPSYRLVRAVPVEEDPEYGYRSRGEVFEEMLSWQGMLPNPHQRTCTTKLKLYPSHALLSEWLGWTEGPRHAGHYSDKCYVAPETAFDRHVANGGGIPKESYLRRARYMTSRPPHRKEQRWRDFTDAPVPDSVAGSAPVCLWTSQDAHHVTVLGLRHDEPRRVDRVMSRSMMAEGAGTAKCRVHTQPPTEHPCFPLVDWEMGDPEVRRYWKGRDFDLDGLPEGAGNCVFCFMKGTRTIAEAASAPDAERVAGAPSDIKWWVRMEQNYRRELPARDGSGQSRFGFLGVRGPTFMDIASNADAAGSGRYAKGDPACDCTD